MTKQPPHLHEARPHVVQPRGLLGFAVHAVAEAAPRDLQSGPHNNNQHLALAYTLPGLAVGAHGGTRSLAAITLYGWGLVNELHLCHWAGEPPTRPWCEFARLWLTHKPHQHQHRERPDLYLCLA